MRENAVSINDVAIDNVTFEDAMSLLKRFIEEKKPRYVVTPNVDHIVRLRDDEEFREVYRNAHLVLADGMPILWAARFLGTPLKEKISGSDILPRFCTIAAKEGYRLFFLGGGGDDAGLAAQKLKECCPGLNIAGIYAPPFGFEKDEEEQKKIISMIRDNNIDILFAGLGTPKQEKWIYGHYKELGVPVSIGIGAGFSFIAGTVRRAPRWMQSAGVEWLWRIIQEPGRLWRRYLIYDTQFLWIVLKDKFARGLRRERFPAGIRRYIAATALSVSFLLIAAILALSYISDGYFRQAQQLEERLQLEKAGRLYSLAMRSDPLNAQYPAALGELLLRQSELAGHDISLLRRAESMYARALRLSPLSAEYTLGLGKAQIGMGKEKIGTAFENFRKALINDPANLNISYAAGYAAMTGWRELTDGQKAFAVERLNESLIKRPEYYKFIYDIAWANSGDFETLKAIAPASLSAQKDLYSFILTRKQLYRHRKSQQEAVDSFMRKEDPAEFQRIKDGSRDKMTRIRQNIADENSISHIVKYAQWSGTSYDGVHTYVDGKMFWSGTLYAPIYLPEGESVITVTAKGSAAGGLWPYMLVLVDGTQIGEAFVESDEWGKYDFKIVSRGGIGVLGITFANDGCDWDRKLDRNLYIKEARVIKVNYDR